MTTQIDRPLDLRTVDGWRALRAKVEQLPAADVREFRHELERVREKLADRLAENAKANCTPEKP